MSQKNHGECKDLVFEQTDGGDGASRILKALAVLRGVRDRRRGKLSLREAIAAALEEEEAFNRWWKAGTPVKRIEVWLETQLLITVVPEEIANLKSVHFDAPSRENSVMQVLKADEGEEPVVLFNVPLNTVRSCGFDRTIEIPNGQKLRVVIAPDAVGRFDMVVAFVPEEDACPLPSVDYNYGEEERSNAKAAGAGEMSSEPWKHLPALIPEPTINVGAWACAFVVLVGGAIYGLNYVNDLYRQSALSRITLVVADERPSTSAKESAVTIEPVENSDPVQGLTYIVRVHPQRDASAGTNPSLPAEEMSSCPLPAIAADKSRSGLTPPTIQVDRQRPQDGTRKVVHDHPNDSEASSEPQVLKPLDAQSQARLASIRYVRVGLDRAVGAEPQELRTLHRSFVRELNTKSKWEVVESLERSEQAMAFFTLSFEPDKSCLGVVSVSVTDVDGKLLWKAYINCKALPKQDHDMMFADASARLIAKLQEPLQSNDDSGESATH
jgi:hypothetical protein